MVAQLHQELPQAVTIGMDQPEIAVIPPKGKGGPLRLRAEFQIAGPVIIPRVGIKAPGQTLGAVALGFPLKARGGSIQ